MTLFYFIKQKNWAHISNESKQPQVSKKYNFCFGQKLHNRTITSYELKIKLRVESYILQLKTKIVSRQLRVLHRKSQVAQQISRVDYLSRVASVLNEFLFSAYFLKYILLKFAYFFFSDSLF